MAGRWLRRMNRMGAASRKARDEALESMTLEQAIAILEALLAMPVREPTRKRRHPVSLSRRRRRRRRKRK